MKIEVKVKPGKYPVDTMRTVLEEFLRAIDPDEWYVSINQIDDTTLEIDAFTVN